MKGGSASGVGDGEVGEGGVERVVLTLDLTYIHTRKLWYQQSRAAYRCCVKLGGIFV